MVPDPNNLPWERAASLQQSHTPAKTFPPFIHPVFSLPENTKKATSNLGHCCWTELGSSRQRGKNSSREPVPTRTLTEVLTEKGSSNCQPGPKHSTLFRHLKAVGHSPDEWAQQIREDKHHRPMAICLRVYCGIVDNSSGRAVLSLCKCLAVYLQKPGHNGHVPNLGLLVKDQAKQRIVQSGRWDNIPKYCPQNLTSQLLGKTHTHTQLLLLKVSDENCHPLSPREKKVDFDLPRLSGCLEGLHLCFDRCSL